MNMQTAIKFELDPHVAADLDCAWTAEIRTADGRLVEMCVIGDPEDDGPSSWDVTGVRNGQAVVFASGQAASFAEACEQAIKHGRRAAIAAVS